MKICKNCGANLESDVLFCTDCGASTQPSDSNTSGAGNSVQQLVHCTNCGMKILRSSPECFACGAQNEWFTPPPLPEKQVHCTNCGMKILQSAPKCPTCGAANVWFQETPQSEKDDPASDTRMKWFGIIAALAILIVLACVIVPDLLKDTTPRGYVTQSLQRTLDRFSQTANELTNNLDFLSVLKQTQNTPHTDKFRFTINYVDTLEMVGGLDLPLNMTSVESDLSNKNVYIRSESFGSAAEFCANGDLIGMRFPRLYGGKAFAVNTKTLGADINANPRVLEKYGDIPEELSFSVFDLQSLLPLLMENPKQYQELMHVSAQAWKDMVDNLTVEKGGAEQLVLHDGSAIECTQYFVTLTAENQINTLRTFMTRLSGRIQDSAYVKQAAEKMDRFLQSGWESYCMDIPITLLIDQEGLVRSAQALYKFSGKDMGTLKLIIRLNGSGSLFNSLEVILARILPEGEENTILNLSCKGNHTGRNGIFQDATKLTLVNGGGLAARMHSTTDYRDGKFVYRIQYGSSADESLVYTGEIDASGENNTLSINLSDNGALYKNAALKLAYTRVPGVSGAGRDFFKGDLLMLLKMTEAERQALDKERTKRMRF